MFSLAKYLLGVALVAGSVHHAAAYNLPPEIINGVMDACRPDYHRLCDYTVPGEGRIAQCLLDHEMELAPRCLGAVKFAYAIEACMPDYYRYCRGVPPGGGRIVECLAERMDMLIPECRHVVRANLPHPHFDRFGPGPYNGPERYPNPGYEQPGHEQGFAPRGPYPGDDDGRFVDRAPRNPSSGYDRGDVPPPPPPPPGEYEREAPYPSGPYGDRDR